MQHFYDGQIRRYLTQIIRMLSNFSYKDSEGKLVQVPVMYGDMTRQVASIINNNSENKVPSAPRMAVYVTGLEMDTTRLADSSYVNKLNIRERAFDEEGKEYLNTQGKNYTVERLMPTPYTLSVNADIWSTNTDQKLQILEQILMLFNPSLEIQTTDNYVDWTSLSVVNLAQTTFSSRSIPMGTESEIDVATLGFTTPIYISPPTKVKQLGVVTNIVTSIFDETKGTIDLEISMPEIKAFQDTSRPMADIKPKIYIDENGEEQRDYGYMDNIKTDTTSVVSTTYKNYDLLVLNTSIKLLENGLAGKITWDEYVQAFNKPYQAGITQIRLKRSDLENEIIGTVTINPLDEFAMVVNWDIDTLPTDTVITGPTGDNSKINFIIDPLKTNPVNLKQTGIRILLLDENLGDTGNTDGPDAWKNADGTDFIASANDIVEWDGSKWSIVFYASASQDKTIYTTNLNTGVQYKFQKGEWLLAFEGEYPHGTWRLKF